MVSVACRYFASRHRVALTCFLRGGVFGDGGSRGKRMMGPQYSPLVIDFHSSRIKPLPSFGLSVQPRDVTGSARASFC